MTPTVQFFDRGRFRLPRVRFAHEERRQLNSWELLRADDATDSSRQSRPTSTVAMINSIQASGLKGPPAKLLGAVDEGVPHGRLQVVEAVVAR